MTILLLVMGTLFVTFSSISYNSVDQIADNYLDTIFDTHIKINITGGIVSDKDYAIAEQGKVYEDNFRANFTQYRGHIPDKVLKNISPEETYSYSNVYYRIYELVDTSYLVSIDMSNFVNRITIRVVYVLLVEIAVYLLLFFIMIWLSKKVFSPLKETFLKQRQFISNASHELKTPIAIISANADVIKSTSSSQWLDNIKSQTDRMEKLVADMLTLAKMDERSDNIKITKSNVSKDLLQTILPFEAIAYEKRKNLNVNIPNDVIHDINVDALKKVATILVDNAIKYTEENGNIYVDLKQDGSKLCFSVKNDGSNVPSEKAKFLFERFYRGDESHSSLIKGSGLGLAIAKSIADNNKWKIYAESKFGVSMEIGVII